MDLQNLFLGKALEHISSEGKIELIGPGRVTAKNLLSDDIDRGKRLVAVQDRNSKKFYIYALAE